MSTSITLKQFTDRYASHIADKALFGEVVTMAEEVKLATLLDACDLIGTPAEQTDFVKSFDRKNAGKRERNRSK